MSEQVAAVEAQPQEAQTTQTTQQDTLSPKFALLAKKERMLRAIDEKHKVREQEWKSKEEKYSSYSQMEERLAKDPINLLIEKGYTPQRIAELLLNGPKEEEVQVRQLKDEINKIKESQESYKKLDEEREKKQYEQTLNQVRNEVKVLVESDPAFETIKDMDSLESVVQLIKQTFDETGNLLSVEEAAKEVEDYLVEEAMKMAKLKKVQARLMPQEQEKTVPVTKTSMTITDKPQLKTLTQAATATTTKPLSDKDRVQRAILAFQGKLK